MMMGMIEGARLTLIELAKVCGLYSSHKPQPQVFFIRERCTVTRKAEEAIEFFMKINNGVYYAEIA